MEGLAKRRAMIAKVAHDSVDRVARAQTRAAAAVLADLPSLPASVLEWLGQASLLYGVPFEYLVPDARMLPNESIRFFYLDENWVRRLIDGAVSIGLVDSEDVLELLEHFEALALAARRAGANTRSQLRRKPARQSFSEGATLTGFLLRSAVVSGWPGLEVQAFRNVDRTDPIPIVRMDRLSDSVLLVLFEGVPKRVDLTEPPEGLHFGVIADALEPPNYEVILRGLGFGGHPPGIQFSNPVVTAPIAKRAGVAGVLDIATSAATLRAALDQQHALPPDGVLSAAGFAIQMVRAPGMQSYIEGATTPLPTNPVPAREDAL